MTATIFQTWQQYCTQELARVNPLLRHLGFILDEQQVHLGGERAVISGRKLVLLGQRLADKKRVVIKASSSPEGKREMELEHTCRAVLDQIQFTSTAFLSPEELIWHEEDGLLLSITAFLEHDRPFLERPFKEQFFLALKAFEAQESAHATTYEHTRVIRGTFRVFETETYLQQFHTYQETVTEHLPEDPSLHERMRRAEHELTQNRLRLEQYHGFLTHGDFVPHNVRIIGRDIYLLDHYDIRFGNKYDGWARFLNFMLLYHHELEGALLYYLEKNRSAEELEALHLMRIYRLGELVWYYVNRLQKSTGDLQTLDRARVSFWGDALEAALNKTSLPLERIRAYQTLRDSLRSDEEKQRQKGLH
jgi:hypothetical protein